MLAPRLHSIILILDHNPLKGPHTEPQIQIVPQYVWLHVILTAKVVLNPTHCHTPAPTNRQLHGINRERELSTVRVSLSADV